MRIRVGVSKSWGEREKERDRRMGVEGDSGRREGGKKDVDSVTHRTTKHFTI